MAEPDDWQPVAPQDDWQAVAPPAPKDQTLPAPFVDRVVKGEAIKRVFDKFSAGLKEGWGDTTPTGFEDATLAQLMELGVFHDPSRGRPNAIQFANEAFMLPMAKAWQALTHSINAGVHGVGGIVGQVAEELGASQGMSERARRETINLANWAMIEGGMGTFSRPRVGQTGPQDHVIGTLPKEADFKTAAELLKSDSAEANLRRAWKEDGIHPAEAINDARSDAFTKHDLTTKPKDYKLSEASEEVLTETGGKPGNLSAAASEAPDVPLSQQPSPKPGLLSARAQNLGETLFDLGRDAQMLTSPMTAGTTESMAMAKDFANTMRRNRWEWNRIDTDAMKRFTPEQRTRMFNAMDEESVAIQKGEPREHQGIATLTPEERAFVVEQDNAQQLAWLRAVDVGLVEGEGIPMHAPRMVMNVANAGAGDSSIALNAIGLNLRTKTASMRHRKYLTVEETEAAAKAKYGNDAYVARDIRALPLATAQLEDAIAGRTLINNIRDYGKRTGAETVVEGAIPTGGDVKWFTMDHPSFRTWKPKFREKEGGGVEVVKDADGNTIFEQVPIYIHGDFEGPLRAVLTQRSGPIYGAMMELKGKTMSLIMNSPMIHNAVEWGRALPAMPGKVATFKIYFEGNRAKNDVNIMREAIDAGLVPIGKRFFKQDIEGIMEAPDLTPGRSWTAKILAAVPGLYDEAAGIKVKQAIDKAGDFWHNTLLWDRIADLQVGLYTNFQQEMMAKGVDRLTASRVAAHWANRYAGALPQEAMSDGARKVANMLLFSRSFTLGNLGVMKDMLTGLPKDVLAQLERDAGFGKGAIAYAETEGAAKAVSYAKTMARRKAMTVVLADMVLMYVGNSLLQSMVNVIRTDRTVDQEMKGYADRMHEALQNVKEHPLALIQPFDFMERLSSTYENEPTVRDRVRVGTSKDGTAIYLRNPAGKIGEEFVGYMNGPLDMLRRKLGTIARPGWQILSNDKGFGRKVYDPTADTPAKYAANLGLIAKHLAESQVPEGQMSAAMDLVKGEGDPNINAAQAFGPIAGMTFRKGAPGGPAVGEMYYARQMHDVKVQMALPDIRKQIQRGDVAGAQQRMDALNIPPGLQRFYIRTTLYPETRLGGRALKDFYLYATPEQRQRLERSRGQ